VQVREGSGKVDKINIGRLISAIGLRGKRIAPPETYDLPKFKVFSDALEAVSIGAGVPAPPLTVTQYPQPQAYCPSRARNEAIVVTTGLIEFDMTDHQIEAIMAIVLCQKILRKRCRISDNSDEIPVSMNPLLEEIGLDKIIAASILSEPAFRSRQDTCEFLLMADTMAVNLTHNPQAASEAIKKFVQAWACASVPELIELDDSKKFPNAVVLMPASEFEGKVYNFRLENLRKLAAGVWQPGSEIRDGRTVYSPEMWNRD
jgi:hypothetical protein